MTTGKAVLLAVVLFVAVFSFVHANQPKRCTTTVVPPPDWHGGLIPTMAPVIWPHITVCK